MGKKINPDVGDSLPPPYQEVVPELNPGPSRPIYPAMQVNQQPPVQMNYNQYLPPPNPPPGQFQPQFNQPNQFRPQYPLNNQVYVYQNQQYPNQFVSQQPMPINQPSVIYVQPGENLHRTLFFVGFCCPLAWCVGCFYSITKRHPHPNSLWWERLNIWLSSILIVWLIAVIVMFSVIFNLH